MFESNGTWLKVDLNETWENNQNVYQEYRNTLDTLAKQAMLNQSIDLAKLRPNQLIIQSCVRYCQKAR